MEKSIKKVKTYNIFLIVLVLLDIADYYFSYTAGDYFATADELGIDISLAIIILVILGIIASIGIFIKLFFVYKGYREIQAKNKGTGYIAFAYVICVLTAVSAVTSIVEILDGEASWIDLIEEICYAFVLFDYAGNCKKIRESR